MSAATPPSLDPSGILSLAGLFRLSVEDYHEMIRSGIISPDDRVELLDGYLVNKMPQDTPHSSTVSRLDEDLRRFAGPGWRVRSQLPITLSNSEPEPDAAVVRGDRRTYDQRQPEASDFGIVAEVADSSVRLDREHKGSLYAAAGIPEYWLVNIPDRQVEVYTDPDSSTSPPVYRIRTDFTTGQAVPLVLDGVVLGSISVSDLLP